MNWKTQTSLIIALSATSALTAWAEVTLVLKNGRRITAQSYREEGSTVKIQSSAGELGIPKDQIQSIITGPTKEPGMNFSGLDGGAGQTSTQKAPPPRPASPPETRDLGPTKIPISFEEQSGYQKRLAEVNRKLAAARQEYITASQGGGTASGATKDGYKALTADLMSRLKDRRGAAETEYEAQELQLRNLRLEIDALEKERETISQEMKAKNFPVPPA
jgi:hypothetical protein